MVELPRRRGWFVSLLHCPKEGVAGSNCASGLTRGRSTAGSPAKRDTTMATPQLLGDVHNQDTRTRILVYKTGSSITGHKGTHIRAASIQS